MSSSLWPVRRLMSVLAALLLGFLAAVPALAARPAYIPARFDRVWQAQERNQRSLMARNGVVGVALGENAAGEPVLKLFLERAGVTGLPDYVDGEAVEAVVTGQFRAGQMAPQAGASAPTDRWPRPVPIGVSIGHTDVTAGTLGCQVIGSDGCHTNFFILSNNHILANSNAGHVGDLILQPGKYDGGVNPTDKIGTLYDFEPVVMSPSANNVMDAAIAITDSDTPKNVGYATPPDGYGPPRAATVTPTVNLKVRKYGRTTRLTTGRITAINAAIQVQYGQTTAQFVQQFVVTGDNSQPFSSAGDSGSLVVVNGGLDDRKVVGLLFAGGGNTSAINPIGPILTRFNVQISGN